jgi:hypothetical protein
MDENLPHMPGIHKYLCDKLKDPCPGCEHSCVVLATVIQKLNNPNEEEQKNLIRQSYQSDIVSRNEGEEASFPVIDQCSRRRLVYNNPLLFNLINCYHGDLPHVIELNWVHGETVTWEKFENEITLENGLTVTFDRKMKEGCINKDTFQVFVVTDDPDRNTTFKFTAEKWRADFILGASRAQETGGKFVIVLKSDFLIDDNKPHKALDGNFIGGKLPSGNGTQGGDFVSWFFVEPVVQNQRQYRPNRQTFTKK